MDGTCGIAYGALGIDDEKKSYIINRGSQLVTADLRCFPCRSGQAGEGGCFGGTILYSNSTKSRIWQRYYLDWDAEKGEYREYKGKKLTEEQFLSYENAQEVKDIVEAEIRKDLAEYYSSDEFEKTEYEYLIRDNGILNINFRFFCGDSVFYYYTILG